MTTIGYFTKKDGDTYEGFIETRLWHDSATMRPVGKSSGKAPDYRVFAGRCEIGAAWKKTSDAGASYLSVSIDDPSFAAPINCRLHEGPQGWDLIWTRS